MNSHNSGTTSGPASFPANDRAHGPVSSRTRSLHRPHLTTSGCDFCMKPFMRRGHPITKCAGCKRVIRASSLDEIYTDWKLQFCACECRCDNPPTSLDEEIDADYYPSSDEEDDNIHQQLLLTDANEQQLASRYGWQVAATSVPQDDSAYHPLAEWPYNMSVDQQVDRDYFLEAPGHATVAQEHDIGIPSESSLVNTENTITESEVRSLTWPLQPWELEAAHVSTGRSYQELARLFRLNTQSMNLPEPPLPLIEQLELAEARLQTMLCPHCNLMRTEEREEWVMSGNAIICDFCGIVQRPAPGEEDPDWQSVNQGVHNALEICLCRCNCDRESLLALEAEADAFLAEMTGSEEIESAGENASRAVATLVLANSPPRSARRSDPPNGLIIDADTDSSDDELDYDDESGADYDDEEEEEAELIGVRGRNLNDHSPAAEAIRTCVGGIDLYLASMEHPEPLLESIRQALFGAGVIHNSGDYIYALRFAEVGIHMCRVASIGAGHLLYEGLIEMVMDLLRYLEEDEDYPAVDFDGLTLNNLLDTLDDVMQHHGHDTIDREELEILLNRFFNAND